MRAGRDPLYTVLLPTHDRADILPFAIRSVLAQTEPDFELLVVGDGCTDDSAAAVRSFDDERIRWYDLPKAPGFGYANRNVALREARGRLVAFMAHDDLWTPDHLELLARPFADPDVVLAYSRPVIVVHRELMVPLACDLEHPRVLAGFLDIRPGLPAGSFVHRRDALDRWGYWNPDLPRAGDMDLWRRFIAGSGRAPTYVREPTNLHFRAHWRPEGRPRTLLVWHRLAQAPGYLPPALRLAVPPDVPEQQAFWTAIAADPEGWTARFRAAVLQALDLRVADADELLVSLLDRWPADATPEALATALAGMSSELESLNASVAWRAVRRLRALRERAVPFGSRRAALWQRVTRRMRPV